MSRSRYDEDISKADTLEKLCQLYCEYSNALVDPIFHESYEEIEEARKRVANIIANDLSHEYGFYQVNDVNGDLHWFRNKK